RLALVDVVANHLESAAGQRGRDARAQLAQPKNGNPLDSVSLCRHDPPSIHKNQSPVQPYLPARPLNVSYLPSRASYYKSEVAEAKRFHSAFRSVLNYQGKLCEVSPR